MSVESRNWAYEAEHVGVELSIDESEFADIEDFLSHHHGVVEAKWRVMTRKAGSMMMRAFVSMGQSSNYTYDIWGFNPAPRNQLEDWYK